MPDCISSAAIRSPSFAVPCGLLKTSPMLQWINQMELKFSAQQIRLSLSDSERLCGRGSSVVEELALRSGWHGLPGERLSIPVGTALNMLILSEGSNHGVELDSMATWLPGLRNEALLLLGENISNWSFEGPGDQEKQFLPHLYGSRETIRPAIARLLGSYLDTTTVRLLYHSQADVEFLSNWDMVSRHTNRAPLFTIDAHKLADKVQATCRAPLFTAKAAVLSWD
jgi:hypothetical protein